MSVPSTLVTCITRSVIHVMLGASKREATRNGTVPVRRLATPNKRNSTSSHLLHPKGRSLSVDSRSVRYYSAGEYSPFTFSVPDFRAR